MEKKNKGDQNVAFFSLENRWLKENTTKVCKIMHSMKKKNSEWFFIVSSNIRSEESWTKLAQEAREKEFLIVWLIKLWNCIPPNIVYAKHSQEFNKRADKSMWLRGQRGKKTQHRELSNIKIPSLAQKILH